MYIWPYCLLPEANKFEFDKWLLSKPALSTLKKHLQFDKPNTPYTNLSKHFF